MTGSFFFALGGGYREEICRRFRNLTNAFVTIVDPGLEEALSKSLPSIEQE